MFSLWKIKLLLPPLFLSVPPSFSPSEQKTSMTCYLCFLFPLLFFKPRIPQPVRTAASEGPEPRPAGEESSGSGTDSTQDLGPNIDGRGIPRDPRANRMGTGLYWRHRSGSLRSRLKLRAPATTRENPGGSPLQGRWGPFPLRSFIYILLGATWLRSNEWCDFWERNGDILHEIYTWWPWNEN